MQRAPAPLILTILGIVLLGPLAVPACATAGAGDGAAPAAPTASGDPAPAEAAPAAKAPADDRSPWESPLWQDATSMMRVYVCDYARRPPSWCRKKHEELPAKQGLPPVQGPPLTKEDAQWLDFIEHANPADLSTADLETVRHRAVGRRDPQAMEILGYAYAEGVGVRRDYAESYRWYGLAYLAGEHRVKPNMDIVWKQLVQTDPAAAHSLTREFDALTSGEVPDSLMTPARAPAAPPGAPLGPPGAPPPPGPHAPGK